MDVNLPFRCASYYTNYSQKTDVTQRQRRKQFAPSSQIGFQSLCCEVPAAASAHTAEFHFFCQELEARLSKHCRVLRRCVGLCTPSEVHWEALRGAHKLTAFLSLLYQTIISKTPKILFHRNMLLFIIDVLLSETLYVHRWHRKQYIFCVHSFVNAVGKLLCVHMYSTEWNYKT